MEEKQVNKNKISVLHWILDNKVKNENGEPIEFQDHRFMLDLYADRTPIQVIQKASQVGASTMEIIRTLHAARYWGINQIYTLPTGDDVLKFVQSKVNRIIKVNECIQEGVNPKSTDSIEQKEIGKSFVFFKGTFTEREAIMLSSDRNIHDELDKSKPEVVRDFASRMGFSKIRSQHYFSTPTIPDYGINKLFDQSDQKHWRFNCPHCGFRQHMEWEKNVDEDRGIYVCQECKKEITPQQINELGSWEARFPGRVISGYWISQMQVPWKTAADLIQERIDADDDTYFYNFCLGLPYLAADQKIPQSLFMRNITEESADTSEEWNVMGIDTGKGSGKGNHCIIGNKKGIFWIGILTDKPGHDRFQQAADLIKFYDIRVVVIDGQPYTEEAWTLAKEFPYRVYLNWFKDDPKMLEVVRFFDEEEGKDKELTDEVKVYSSRTRIIDDTISALRRGEIKFAMKVDSPNFKMLIQHAQTLYARNVTDKFGQTKREWANTGADDFFLALVYWQIALKKRNKYEPNK
ncbi:MAG: phage terminase large subunit family protein [Candidatus Daviesbacteria bacterium]|nr:phage terminase large subunit family protein [Candidatus Daviesbacteria bacterium]